MASSAIRGYELTYGDDRLLSWTPAPRAHLECHSHAVTVRGRSWLIDPIDVPGLDDMLASRPPVDGVVVLLNRHLRDSTAIAARHGVSVWVPKGMSIGGMSGVETYDASVDDLPFEVIPIVSVPGWLERALWWPEARVLMCADCVGSASYYRTGADAVGVHPVLRGLPPRKLERVNPDVICFGHGRPVSALATTALHRATRTSRRQIPSMLIAAPQHLRRWTRSARPGC